MGLMVNPHTRGCVSSRTAPSLSRRKAAHLQPGRGGDAQLLGGGQQVAMQDCVSELSAEGTQVGDEAAA